MEVVWLTIPDRKNFTEQKKNVPNKNFNVRIAVCPVLILTDSDCLFAILS